MEQKKIKTISVWNFRTRIFHWLLVALISFSVFSSEFEPQYFVYHKLSGYSILVLVLYRFIWGFFGEKVVRFSSFVRPYAAWSYAKAMLRGKEKLYLGHNPLGGLMVVALLGVVFIQALLGLFSVDDVPPILEGPFAFLLSEKGALFASALHHLGFNVIILLVVIHVSANIFYTLFKDQNLIGSMLTGKKKQASYEDMDSGRQPSVSDTLALRCLLIAAVIVMGIVGIFGYAPFY